ncbi:segregation/condensation protein A, partial [Clostridium saudiense]|nr:segregation/condensation protein A [Clostridium saudiense]
IYVDKYKIEDKMNVLVKRFENDEVVEFSSIMMESECKMEIVVTFLAVLELIKIRVIKVYQEDNFGNILMKRRREN